MSVRRQWDLFEMLEPNPESVKEFELLVATDVRFQTYAQHLGRWDALPVHLTVVSVPHDLNDDQRFEGTVLLTTEGMRIRVVGTYSLGRQHGTLEEK